MLNNQLVNAQRELAKSRAQAEREREFLLVTLRSIGDGVAVMSMNSDYVTLSEQQ
jgi:nitrogen fixation/metabolism regulation signal transduction histidine kinase